MKIHNKWKFFAMANFLSDWEGDAAELFDKLQEAENSELTAIFENFSICVWQPLEYWAEVDVVEKIIDLATSAQLTDNKNSKNLSIDTKLCSYLADYLQEEKDRGVSFSEIDKYTIADAIEAYNGGAAYE